ncbi:transcription factor 7-like 1-A [Seriola aureovittata]|uniref:transcription factor 7-like 1-A n=1 Tax=Seriola aureovittata TaxID=2871759 RepID=UPI0024BE9E80|nr:transcription factor 7-like 1-A [Seriola aureovittata]
MKENLVTIGIVNGELVYGFPAEGFPPVSPCAPSPNTSMSLKRKSEIQQDEGRPYIKKPPNAFMLFRKEQRAKVVAELNNNNNATVNTVIGQRWKSMSKEEQAKYHEEAEKERTLHSQQFPDWSCSDNYGKKRKRVRRKARTTADASASQPEEVTQQAKKLCVIPVQTYVMQTSALQSHVMQTSALQSHVMQPSTLQSHVMQPSTLHTEVMESSTHHGRPRMALPVCDGFDLLARWRSGNI